MCAIRFLLVIAAAILIPVTHTNADNGMGSLTVTVKDFRRGTPIEGARILITPCNYSGTTGSGGTLLFAEVTPFRNYQVDVDADGYIHGAAGFVAVAADDENELVIPLKQTSILRGQVTAHLLFGLIRWPLRDATVKLQQEIDGSFITRGETQTDILGRYRFADLDEGEFRISARAEGFATASADITVDGGKRIIRNLSLLPQQEESTAAYGNESAGQSCCGGKTAYRSAAVTSDPCTVSAKQPVITNQGYFTPPEAVASVIPGPSELPYIYNNGRVLASSNGSRFVAAGTPVFLRGFAIDPDLPSPQEFNPDAPCFDIYENKNGNFSASIFSYRWTLMSSGGEDVSSLLQPSATEENVFFTVPEDAQPGDVLTASLVVTDDLQNASVPLGTTIVVSESVDDAACYECHGSNAAGYEATAHATVAGGAGCQDCHGLGSEH
ncbi:MAG: Cna domain protein, partial [Deltaproteobacteria bacterium]|nr:Cna domain protein [Deltaproteobacteria bacterium]